MKLRLSDTYSHAEEFRANTLSEFTLGVYEALQRYQAHFATINRPTTRPHLHVWIEEFGGRWIDAGYGRGTMIILYQDMIHNTAFLAEIWQRCQSAERNSISMSEQIGGMLDAVTDEVRKPDNSDD